jgi:outer membrane murein-binding lipoprotein Lpp
VLAKGESLSTDLSAQIATLATKVNTKIDSVKENLAKQDTRLNSLEGDANTYSDKVVTLEEQVIRLSSDVVKLTSKVEDLENRQGRRNGHTFGMREGLETVGGLWPTMFIAKLLQEILGLIYAPTHDREHRILQSAPKNGEPRFHELHGGSHEEQVGLH